ncbi:MAG: HNH endonuclease [Acidobacteria bacterium]|nr:HNH endonuclease [Acidobacteriota bacterium]
MSLASVLAHEVEIRRAVAKGASKRSIFKRLHCNNETLDQALLILGIDYKGNRGGKGYKRATNKKPLAEFLKRGSAATIKRLKPRLIEEGLKQARCELCLRRTWRGQLIPLDLHHKNGDPKDNRLENLELLCPNCHRMTENWGTRRRFKARSSRG